MKNLNRIYPSMKSKRRSSESKKKTNISVNKSNGIPTSEPMFYENNNNYSKYKDYEKYMAAKGK